MGGLASSSRRSHRRCVVTSACALSFFVGGALAEPLVRADPQWTVGTTVGGAMTDLRSGGPHAAFHLGLHGDVVFLRRRESDMGLGPYVEIMTEAFETVETGGGLSWLVPAVSAVPFVLSGGAFARRAPVFGWEPGLAARVFFGPRGYNFNSTYGMTNGLFVDGRFGLGDGKQADVIFGAQLDLVLLALPFVFAYEAIAH